MSLSFSGYSISVYKLHTLLMHMKKSDEVNNLLEIIKYFITCEKLLLSINYAAFSLKEAGANTKRRLVAKVLRSNMKRSRLKIMVILKNSDFIKCKG